ncbi:MAG: hypothetical protein IPP47_24570 [Bryobacterales bacterium]|nr:hypothetical protein [Bryobacterales bacterium]
MADSKTNEHIVLLGTGVNREAVLAAIAEAGIKVTNRIGGSSLIINLDRDEAEVARLLPAGARLLKSGEAIPAGLSKSEIIQLRAARLRRTPAYRQLKLKRAHEGVEWGKDGLDAPDDADDESHGGKTGPESDTAAARSFAPGAEIPSNERLINDVAVGVVLVNGHGDYALSEDTKDQIVAEVQEGLNWLGNQEPDARVTWVLDVKEATVDITPWQGARWPGMPEAFFKGPDAALLRGDNGKIYFFLGSEYVRFSSVAGGMDAGYPKPIAGNWPGLPADFQAGIDAALWRQSNNCLYFFKGSQYVRFTTVEGGVDAGYPKPIAGNWPGLPAEFQTELDAVLQRKDNGHIYMFKGDKYVRFSSVAAGVDAGFPKPIKGNWKGMPDSFNEGIDAALWRDSNSKIYFFKKGRMYGKYVRITNVPDGVDAGYEEGVPIGLSTGEAELLWRDPAMAQLGFPAGDEGLKQWIGGLKTSLDTQWAIGSFYTKHPTTWFAYAGGGRTVIRYANFSPTKDFDRIVSHETGHLFGCPDEYASSKCTCGATKGKFFSQPNDNCANCTPDLAIPCIMRSNSGAMCPSTPWHLGWGAFLTKIDAALWRGDNDKIYLFSNKKYIRITDVPSGRDEGYPTNIAGNWKGLPNSFKQGIDAALWRESNSCVYLFKGSQYVRFTKVSDGVDAGYPKSIASSWPGLPASFQTGIDAALWRESNGKIYFFKGNQYVRFSSVAGGVDAGYPKPIAGNWNGLPASFADGIDAVLMREDNHKIYFFKGRKYARYSDADNTMDAGYPKFINGNWIPFPR